MLMIRIVFEKGRQARSNGMSDAIAHSTARRDARGDGESGWQGSTSRGVKIVTRMPRDAQSHLKMKRNPMDPRVSSAAGSWRPQESSPAVKNCLRKYLIAWFALERTILTPRAVLPATRPTTTPSIPTRSTVNNGVAHAVVHPRPAWTTALAAPLFTPSP